MFEYHLRVILDFKTNATAVHIFLTILKEVLWQKRVKKLTVQLIDPSKRVSSIWISVDTK